MLFYCYIFIFQPRVTPFISPLKSGDSRLKILINEWSEIFISNWALKAQGKRELRFERQVLSEIFKAKLNSNNVNIEQSQLNFNWRCN